MTRILVVASPTLTPLSTDGPIPTDGQPEWHRNLRTGARDRRSPATADRLMPATIYPDGPYPFTVAVWQEVVRCVECGAFADAPAADGFGCRGVRWTEPEIGAGERCEGEQESVGAVVATVEVTGKGHHTHWTDEADAPEWELCCPDAPPYGWHTPTGEVTRLDVPIPMARPDTKAEGHYGEIDQPAPWWWADLPVHPTEQGDVRD